MTAGVDPSFRRRPAWVSALLYSSAALLALLAVGPAAWLLLVALQPAGTDMGSLSRSFTLANFAGAWRDGNLALPLLNSLATTIVRAGLNVFIAALAAYPLARMSFRGRDTMLVLILATMMIPEQVIVVPMFRTVVQMGLADTLIALILPVSVSAMGVFMCRQAFLQIPASLEEAARIDGAGSWQVFTKVILPLSAPTLATLGIFSVIAAWSDLLWPLLVLQSQDKHTLPVAVNQLLGVFATNQRYAFAGSVLSLIPVLIAFMIAQRWLKPGMLAGAVKG
jgi:putative chitobiose transport system permease protein